MEFPNATITIMGDHIVVNGNYTKNVNYGTSTQSQETSHVSASDLRRNSDIQDIVPVKESNTPQEAEDELQPQLDIFQSYLSVVFCQRKDMAYTQVVDLICSDEYSDREKAYFALKIYETKGIMKTAKRPASFKAWYRIFCDIFHLKFHPDYTKDKILPATDRAQIIDNYIYVTIAR